VKPASCRTLRASPGRFPLEGVRSMQIDGDAIARVLEARRDELLARVRREVGTAVSSMPPSEALTFLWMDGEHRSRSVAPAVSADYAKTLIAFVNGKPIGRYRIESAVTPKAMQAAQEAIIGFYASPETSDAIVDAILEQLAADRTAGDGMGTEPGDVREWLAREIGAAGNLDSMRSIGDPGSLSADRLEAFFQTTLGRKILLALGKATATSAGKVMVLRLVQASVQKVMASEALKSALLASLRKVGLGAFVKSATGKAVIALLAMAGVAHVPLVLVVMPVIAGFLFYEYRHFPAKLAGRLPDEVADVVAGNFAQMNRSIVDGITAAAMREIADELTKPRPEPA
jgi:hypothetical protein